MRDKSELAAAQGLILRSAEARAYTYAFREAKAVAAALRLSLEAVVVDLVWACGVLIIDTRPELP
jgi:hypothetical protein